MDTQRSPIGVRQQEPLVTVPFVDLRVRDQALKADLVAAATAVLESGAFILGPAVDECEQALARRCGTRYAVGVASGTDALLLTLRALGVGPGDEVLTPANAFLSSTSVIALAGARPLLVDVCEKDLNLDPARLEALVTPRTKAMIVVHLTGRPAQLHPILSMAQRYGLPVIEDCAQAIGARYHGQPVGSFGIAGCFSFHPLKQLGAYGDGGAIVTSDPILYKRLVMARNHGLRNRDQCAFWSVNSRLDTMQAAFLNVKLRYLDGWIAEHRAIAAGYCHQLTGVVQVPEEEPHEFSVYQTFIIQAAQRDALQVALAKRGIETRVHYPIPLHLQEPARALGYGPGDCPMAEQLSQRILSLPIYPTLTAEQQEAVVAAIRDFYGDGGGGS